MWTAEHAIVCDATPRAIWELWRDVDSWGSWNAGIATIELHGPFVTGSEFTMRPPGEEAFRSRLVDVREGEAFVDETRLGDVVVRVTHRLERLEDGRTRIVYATAVEGPEAADIGAAVSADFPGVLAALAALAVLAERAKRGDGSA